MIKNVIFDYGNVLVDWNPAYLFLPVFNGDEEKCRFFTDHICNREWFTRMDRGESMDVCVAELQARCYSAVPRPLVRYVSRRYSRHA